MALRTVGVRLAAEVSGYANSLRAASRSTRDFGGELDRAARAGHLDAVADQAAGMGVALAGGFAVAINAAAKFDKQMSAVGAATHASVGEMGKLRAAALQAGKDTSFSASEAAEGIEELSKAGVSTAAILNGGLKGALDLAAAGGLEVSEAAELAASAMTQFKLESSQVPHVADLLAAGAGKAQGSVHDLGAALNQAGLVASQMGLSVEDTTGTLAAFASAGMIGSDAGTSLKTTMLMLANPTDKAAGLMEELGINAYDAGGNFVGISALAGQLKDKLGGLTQEQRNAALATIFGSDAIRAASILYEQGADGIQGWIDKTNDAGFAAETARTRMDNLSGDIERLTGSLETLAIESSTGASSGLRTLVQGADNMVTSLSGVPGPVQNAGVVIAGVGGAALLAAAGAAKLRRSSAEALGELRNAGPIGTRAANGLERAGKAAGRAAIALAAIQTASALMGDSINPQVELLGRQLEEFAKSGKVGSEASRVFGGDLGILDTALKDVADTGAWSSFSRGTAGMIEGLTGLGSVMDSSLQHSKERLSALDQTLSQMVQSGQGAQAAAIFKAIADRAAEQGVSVDELNKVLPGYAAAVELAGTKSSGAAGGVTEVKTAAEEAKEKVDALKAAFDALFGIELDLDRASIAFNQGLKAMHKELETGTRTLDTNKQAGADNATAVLDQIEKIKNLRQARLDHNMSLDEADGKYKKDIAGLRATLLQMGYNETEVDALVGKYYTIPEKYNTDLTAKDKATPTINAIKHEISTIHGRTVTIAVKYETHGRAPGEHIIGQGTQLKDRWGGIHEGGYIKAAQGVLRDAAMFGPRSPGRYMFAEPETGGELFAPKNGDLNRTRAMVGYAIENWWGGWGNFGPRAGGGGPTPMPAGGGGLNVENLNVRAYSDRFSLGQVMNELAMQGVH